jgi:small subunit ribosomal protein S17
MADEQPGQPTDTGAEEAGDGSEMAVAPDADKAVTPPPSPSASTWAGAAAGRRGNARKVREGLVVSDRMSNTVVVAVVERVRHARYGKTVQRTKKLYAHDAENSARVGDRVRVIETRPLSKLKRWRVSDVLERAR